MLKIRCIKLRLFKRHKNKLWSLALFIIISLLLNINVVGNWPNGTPNYTAAAGVSTWNGLSTDTNFTGSGSESDPYIIDSAAKLAGLASEVNAGTTYAGKFFKLGANLDLSMPRAQEADKVGWAPIGNGEVNKFMGTFDGDNHTITLGKLKAFLYGESKLVTGIFGYTKDATIKNIIVNGVVAATANEIGELSAGTLVGYGDRTTISNCASKFTSFTVSSMRDGYTGGMAGYMNNSCTIKSCYNTGAVTTTLISGTGGIAGCLSSGGTMQNCYNMGAVNATPDPSEPSAGGLTSTASSFTIKNCYRAKQSSSCRRNYWV